MHLDKYTGAGSAGWVHILYTYGGAGQLSKYYVNGSLGIDVYTGQGASRVQTTVTCWGPVLFSELSNPFNGTLDEIRMYTSAHSSSWAQLSYQNQRLGH